LNRAATRPGSQGNPGMSGTKNVKEIKVMSGKNRLVEKMCRGKKYALREKGPLFFEIGNSNN